MNLEVFIGSERADTKDLSISINYQLESADNFQQKKSDQAYDLTFPYTIQNTKIANRFNDPSVEDNTPGQIHRNPKSCAIIVNGVTILEGKAFLQNATKKGFEYSFYGGNADWLVDLKSTTLADFLKDITFLFTKANMVASWVYDGTDINLPYVFAPVRYRGLMDNFNSTDTNVETTYLRPAVSVYWIIYKAFKSIGYKIESEFFNTEFFRRLTMPWTWGNFLDSDGTKLQIHKFLAKTEGDDIWFENFSGFPNLVVTNDFHDGGYDNNDDYEFAPIPTNFFPMVWHYKPPHFGTLEVTLSSQLYYNCTLVGNNSYVYLQIVWEQWRPGIPDPISIVHVQKEVLAEFGKNLGRKDFVDIFTDYKTFTIEPDDFIYCYYILDIQHGTGVGSRANIVLNEMAFQLEYFRIPLGGTIAFDNYTGLKNHNFLDFLGGVCDTFDLSFNTDNKNKVVRFEPTHPVPDLSPGYYNGKTLNWTKKQLDEDFKLNLFSDYERELYLKFKDDASDGIVKILQDRNSNTLSMGKYMLPPRFKSEKRQIINRFFSPVAHYNNVQMKDITGVAPQLICLIPENVANTSNREAANTFTPKLTYYKGITSGVGGWKYDGEEKTDLPFMFAVNYKDTDHTDPVLSYSDERLDDNTIVKGLLKKFFWQRLAIIRNGQYFTSKAFLLNNNDVNKVGHREFKIIDGIKYELISIDGFNPITEGATNCYLKKWVPVSQEDSDNSYPSSDAYIVPAIPLSEFDIKYVPAVCLTTDIPTK